MNKRWLMLFAGASWLDMIGALYEGPGSDWEGCGTALDQLLYELAKARGLDTTQTCPRCKRVVDQAGCIGDRSYEVCDSCIRDDEARHAENARVRAANADRHRAWLESLTPAQRAEHESIEQRTMLLYAQGLIKRDVQ